MGQSGCNRTGRRPHEHSVEPGWQVVGCAHSVSPDGTAPHRPSLPGAANLRGVTLPEMQKCDLRYRRSADNRLQMVRPAWLHASMENLTGGGGGGGGRAYTSPHSSPYSPGMPPDSSLPDTSLHQQERQSDLSSWQTEAKCPGAHGRTPTCRSIAGMRMT